jgi:hypothetical protein
MMEVILGESQRREKHSSATFLFDAVGFGDGLIFLRDSKEI